MVLLKFLLELTFWVPTLPYCGRLGWTRTSHSARPSQLATAFSPSVGLSANALGPDRDPILRGGKVCLPKFVVRSQHGELLTPWLVDVITALLLHCLPLRVLLGDIIAHMAVLSQPIPDKTLQALGKLWAGSPLAYSLCLPT